MAYQQVGTPRFYIDAISWLDLLGVKGEALGFNVGINPNNVTPSATSAGESVNMLVRYENNSESIIPSGVGVNYVAVLGHNWSGVAPNIYFSVNGSSNSSTLTHTEIVNASITSNNNVSPTYDGFSIIEFDKIEDQIEGLYIYVLGNGFLDVSKDLYTGSVLCGKYWDAPHSPDLNVSLSYEYGTKEITTRGGASLSNSFYSKPPMWGDLGAWELGDGSANQNLSRSGRKIYDLSFSFLSQEDVFPKYDELNTLASDPNAVDPEQYTLQGSGDFYSEVIRKTQMQLPFIFQADNTENSFIIAKFDQNSFTLQQTAPNLYNAKCRVKECW